MAQNISFNSNSLQTANILTANIDHEHIPDKSAQMFALSHANASRIPFISYPSKSITVTGKIIDTTVALLDARLDTFRGYFTGQDQNLDIDYGGSTRRYIATVGQLSINRPGGLLYAEFSITFVCTQPFGQNTSTTTALSASARTLTGYTDAHTFLGTAPVQWPIITYTLNSFTSPGNLEAITIGNNATGQNITVNRTFAAGDVIVIDAGQKTVTANGVGIDFSGAFPEFAPGSQTITYNDFFFTTRNFNISIVYYPMYL